MVSKTSVDLPDPDTPVKMVKDRLGMSTLMLRRLLSLAPITRMYSVTRPILKAAETTLGQLGLADNSVVSYGKS